MTDAQLTTLSTIAWLIGTVTAFVLLARWSAAGSWGVASAIARGLTGWAGRSGGAEGVREGDDLTPMATPRLDRLWGDSNKSVASPDTFASVQDTQPVAEVEELASRRI